MATSTVYLPYGQYVLVASPGDGPLSISVNSNIRYVKSGRTAPNPSTLGVSLAKGLVKSFLDGTEQDSYLWAIQDGSADTQPAQLTKTFNTQFDDPGDSSGSIVPI